MPHAAVANDVLNGYDAAGSSRNCPMTMRNGLPWLALAIIIQAGLLLPGWAGEPAQQVALVLLAYAVAGAGFAGVLILIVRRSQAAVSRSELVLIVVAGVVFRATLFPLPPATSPDVHRYLWEGLVHEAGFSPYVHPPAAEVLDPLADAYPTHAANVRQPSVHPEIPAIYPPTVQMLFWANAALFHGALWGWKLILLAFDGLLAVAVMVLLRQAGQSYRWLAAMWWCPLLLLETYEGAHLDLVGVSLLTAAIALCNGRRYLTAGALLGLSINVKYLWPGLVFLYLLPRVWRERRALRFGLATLAMVGLAWLPYRAGLVNVWQTSRHFMEHWAFNDLLFELLRLLGGPPWLPGLLAGVLLLTLTAVLALRSPREERQDVWRLTGAGLLLSPVAYPWYFLWVLPGLAGKLPGWLVAWVFLVPALHIVDWHYAATGEWDHMKWLWYVVGVVPGLLLLHDIRRRLANRSRTDAPLQETGEA